MTIHGGTVLFSDEVLLNELAISKLIQDILIDRSTMIEVIRVITHTETTGIFKITVNEIFSKFFKSNPIHNINAPRVLIIKLFINYQEYEVANEIAIQSELGSRTNIMPICPSFLFSERIQTPGEEMTILGKLFYSLFELKAPIQYGTFRINFGDKTPLTSAYIQDILIMEFIDCETYFAFCKSTLANNADKTITEDSFYKYITHNIEIKLSTDKELRNFYTYYMASLLAIKGYHHDDIHNSNIMICSTTEVVKSEQHINQLNTERTNVVPCVIDFGRAGRITQDELEFYELTPAIAKSKLGIDDTSKEPQEPNTNYFAPIYINALRNNTRIVEYVESLLKAKNYVDAVLTLSMCKNPKERYINSMFIEYYEFDHISYRDLYKMNEERKKKYNSIIQQLIEKRNQLELALELQLIQKKEKSIVSGLIKTKQEDGENTLALEEKNKYYSIIQPLEKANPIVSGSKINYIINYGGKLVLRRQKKFKKSKKSKKSKTKKYKKSKIH